MIERRSNRRARNGRKTPKNVLFVFQNCTFRFADYSCVAFGYSLQAVLLHFAPHLVARCLPTDCRVLPNGIPNAGQRAFKCKKRPVEYVAVCM